MMRHLVFLAAVGWCCAAQAADGPSGPDRTRPASQRFSVNQPSEQPAGAKDESVPAAMHRVIELKLNEVPLSNAVDKLRDVTGASIFVNWKALEAVGVSRSDPISLHLQKVHASTALDLLLRVASPESPRLGWAVDKGVINVSSADDLAKNVEIRVYDIRDLVGTTSVHGNREQRVRAVMKLLRDRIDPGSWRENGGSVAAMRELQGQLIVTQTRENHRAILDLVESLRALNAAGVR